MRVAVVGGGWAGCAAAVEALGAGHMVTLYEMAAQVGGRARRVEVEGFPLDNGQHILIGAYSETLRLMRAVGARTTLDLLRLPLQLGFPDGTGLFVPRGPAPLAFLQGLWAARHWTRPDRLRLIAAALGWALRGWRCPAHLTVAQLTAALPGAVRCDLIDPLCVAALNTPPAEASAAVFLRVLRDALWGGPGASDLLLPRVDLSRLFPERAVTWMRELGAEVRLLRRVHEIRRGPAHWELDGGERFDAVVLATPPWEAARLARQANPAWAAQAAQLSYEPIVTVYLRGDGVRLPAPLLALRGEPAQFVFDHGQLDGPQGLLAFVVSGARSWADRGINAVTEAARRQAEAELARFLRPPLRAVRTVVEKRATFRCTPTLERPGAQIAENLWAAGDYIAGPYPATLEGAVRSGVEAARALARGR